jgi:hypothetical protein
MLLATIPFLAGSATPDSINTEELHAGSDGRLVAACCYEGQYVPSNEDQCNEIANPCSWTLPEILIAVLTVGLIFWLGRLTVPSDRPSKDDVEKAISSVFDARRKEALVHDSPSILKVGLTEAEAEVKKKLEKDFKLR